MTPIPDILSRWLSSGAVARIAGLEFVPLPQPLVPASVWCITNGQASVYLLRQVLNGHTWFLKQFSPRRRPEERYLVDVARFVPGYPEFISCTQRRHLRSTHVDNRTPGFMAADLSMFVAGCILTPKVPGQSWATLADDLRSGRRRLSAEDRLRVALNLARAVDRLETGACCHRDLSGGNVFIETCGRIHLIDWDSLFHEELCFQFNTTIGTPGYIAPFTQDASGKWHPRCTWVHRADRFALAVLIIEFLLVDHTSPAPHEDGTLFSQNELNLREPACLQGRIAGVESVSKRLKSLAWRALFAADFEKCPSPMEWVQALRRVLAERGKLSSARPVISTCGVCGAEARIGAELHDRLRRYGRLILCRQCLRAHRPVDQAAGRHDPRVSLTCEHCRIPLSKSRTKADDLRQRGKPLLCGTCLKTQLATWTDESRQRDEEYPRCSCGRCGAPFRLPRVKIELLKSRGRVALCKTCFAVGGIGNSRSPCRPLFFRP